MQNVQSVFAQSHTPLLPAPTPNHSLKQSPHQTALARVIARIRESLDLATIFQTTATEVRYLLSADRVGVFRFYPDQDWEGELVAEDIAEGVRSILNRRIHDPCFSERFADLYRQGHISATSDFGSGDFPDCYRDLMTSLQVQANVVAPLLNGEQLWGLLCIHQCHADRQWQDAEIEFVRQIAEHLSIALHHSNLLSQARIQTQRQQALTAVITRIRESLDLATIFQTTAKELRQLLSADRVGVFRFYPDQDWEGELVAEDVTTGVRSALAQRIRDHCFSERFSELYRQGHINVVSDFQGRELKECYQELMASLQVRANIVAPLLNGEHLWGLLCIHQCHGPRQWENSEIEFVRQIADQLSVALQQADYLERVQQQSQQLAEISERQRAAERQRALAQTVDRIRRSLEIETIFQTSTEEVNQLLETDRTVIYRFNHDWSGEFVAETVSPGWISVMEAEAKVTDTCLQQTQGGRYWNNRPHRVEDIYAVGYSDCHIDLLERMQVRAFMIVPIMQGNHLWGLLATYQNSGTRGWQDFEAYMLSQIGSQLGVALQQAQYLQRLEQQATQLEKVTSQQRALAATVDKIRRSLDIGTIFQTTTHEVRQMLGVERVAIYRFYEDWSGEFVADSIVDDWQPLRQTNGGPGISPLSLKAVAPGSYPRNETFVPILQGEQLWGLLMAYQSEARLWPEEDVSLLAQVGSQLGVALQQAELLEQTRSQKEEITQALTEIKRSQAHLIQAEKMAGLGQLVAGVAHEINNPVNFIAGNLSHARRYSEDLLSLVERFQQSSPELDPELAQYIEQIDLEFIQRDLPATLASMTVGTERIHQIVRSLRNFSRQDQAEVKAVDIHEGIESTLLILQHRFEHGTKPIELVKQFGQLPRVACYPAQLNQVFMNIISNAIDALQEHVRSGDTPEDFVPTITITTEQLMYSGRVQVVIGDNGPGISAEAQNQVFDPFFTTKEPGQGTGLGLSISHQIVVERHSGQLQLVSPPGRGTEFIIEIPITQPGALQDQGGCY